MKLAFVCVGAAVCAAGLSACSDKEHQSAVPPAPPEVLVKEVVQKDVPIAREWVGTLDGSANVDVRARVGGYLIKSAYKEGTVVKPGDVLFEIDARPYVAALAQARAELARLRAVAVKAELDEKRELQLFASKVSSEANKETAVQNSMAAKAAVEAAAALVDQSQLNLDFCKITSPVEGIAGNAKPGVGDLIGANNSELTTVSAVDPVNATFQLSEQDYLKVADKINDALRETNVQPDMPTLELILADGSVHPYKGRFTKINRQVDAKTGTIEIGASFPNPGNILRPGQFARIRSMGKIKQGAILVPQRAVNELQGGCQVAVVGADGKVEIRPVKAAEIVGNEWVIDEGLKPGEKVIVEGFQKVRAGMPVTVKPWAPGKTSTEAK